MEVTPAQRLQLKEITGRMSVPALFIGGTWIGGCNDGGLGGVAPLAASGKLQELVAEVFRPKENEPSVDHLMYNNPVLLMASSKCRFCTKAIEILEEHKIEFKVRMVMSCVVTQYGVV